MYKCGGTAIEEMNTEHLFSGVGCIKIQEMNNKNYASFWANTNTT